MGILIAKSSPVPQYTTLNRTTQQQMLQETEENRNIIMIAVVVC